MGQKESRSQHIATVTHHADGSKTIHLAPESNQYGSNESLNCPSTCSLDVRRSSDCPRGTQFQPCTLGVSGRCCSPALSQTAPLTSAQTCSRCQRGLSSCPSPLVLQSCQSNTLGGLWLNGKQCCAPSS